VFLQACGVLWFSNTFVCGMFWCFMQILFKLYSNIKMMHGPIRIRLFHMSNCNITLFANSFIHVQM